MVGPAARPAVAFPHELDLHRAIEIAADPAVLRVISLYDIFVR